ncbi:MAG: hypothetical protein OYG31_01430 [Candidatus Kaiserbacteria bacterium]|nr:hypothetical protein [Candidatus Kaiserbacteria bacterium]
MTLLVCTGVVAVNMYLSYMGARHMHIVHESEADIYAMRDKIMHTVADAAKEPAEDVQATVSHLVTVNEATISVSLP